MNNEIYLSFFMFTADLQPDNAEYTQTIIRHIRHLTEYGYTGFDLPIVPTMDPESDVEKYVKLKRAIDEAGLGHVKFTTNVFAPRTFDPSSPFAEQRALGLKYLKSRVDITAALGGHIMAGPIVIPYNVFPTTDLWQPIWSDALQDWAAPRYENARPIFEELGAYAAANNVKLAIEPVDHWETPAPNMVGEVLAFLERVKSPQIGVCIDSAHVVLGSQGPASFVESANRAAAMGRVHYVQISAPDRGAVHDSWIPWTAFLDTVLPAYDGPLLVEVFNAIPVFLNPLRLTRRKFWIPDEDRPVKDWPSAYVVALEAILEVRQQLEAQSAPRIKLASGAPI